MNDAFAEKINKPRLESSYPSVVVDADETTEIVSKLHQQRAMAVTIAFEVKCSNYGSRLQFSTVVSAWLEDIVPSLLRSRGSPFIVSWPGCCMVSRMHVCHHLMQSSFARGIHGYQSTSARFDELLWIPNWPREISSRELWPADARGWLQKVW